MFVLDRDKTLALLEVFVKPAGGKAAGQQEAVVEPSGQVTTGQLEASGCQTSRLSGFIRIPDSEGRTADSVPVSVSFGQRGETAAVWKESKVSKWKGIFRGRERDPFHGRNKAGNRSVPGDRPTAVTGFPGKCGGRRANLRGG